MKNIVKIISLNEDVEEEAVVQIKNIKFATFIAYAPYVIDVDKCYPVEISFFVDEVDIQENSEAVKDLTRIDESFEYIVKGYLNDKGQLDVGFLIEDDVFEDYQYLYGKYVRLKVDRINLEFVIEE